MRAHGSRFLKEGFKNDIVVQGHCRPTKSDGLKLPNLNAQQQQALQSLMNLGQLGSTKEGKKVRR